MSFHLCFICPLEGALDGCTSRKIEGLGRRTTISLFRSGMPKRLMVGWR
ncbi:MAG: hypothetical protein SFU25_08170 [Candidatus Caenarcaniphilales bacterium]|nr:hypothetical protein [Candidatus Caenarcaniphilales bacterium]